MTQKLALLVVLVACAEPDPIDEILQDVDATKPPYADGDVTIDELVARYCPGVVFADGVTTYRGITGTYRRSDAAATGELSRLVLVAQRDDPDAAGTFTATTAPFALTSGKFAAITDNPAIGAAISFDVGGDGAWDDLHFVLGTRRAFGRVAALCLAGPARPFMLTRTLF